MRFKRDFIHVQRDKSERKSKYSHMSIRNQGRNKYRDKYGEEAIRKAAEAAAIEKEKLEQRIIDAAAEKAELEAAAAADKAELEAKAAEMEAEAAIEKAKLEQRIIDAAAEKAELEAAAAAETAARLAAEAVALADRDEIADEVTAKATQSQDERDQLYSVSTVLAERIADIEWNENVFFGEVFFDHGRNSFVKFVKETNGIDKYQRFFRQLELPHGKDFHRFLQSTNATR